jgi:hypothetical protein
MSKRGNRDGERLVKSYVDTLADKPPVLPGRQVGSAGPRQFVEYQHMLQLVRSGERVWIRSRVRHAWPGKKPYKPGWHAFPVPSQCSQLRTNAGKACRTGTRLLSGLIVGTSTCFVGAGPGFPVTSRDPTKHATSRLYQKHLGQEQLVEQRRRDR